MGGRVLVVDDEPGMRLLGSLLFEERGLEVDVAGDGHEALERCARGDVAALVLDYKMPGMTGLDVLLALRERGDQTPVVIYSGYLHPKVVDHARAHGAEMVDKTETEQLLDLVESMVNPPS